MLAMEPENSLAATDINAKVRQGMVRDGCALHGRAEQRMWRDGGHTGQGPRAKGHETWVRQGAWAGYRLWTKLVACGAQCQERGASRTWPSAQCGLAPALHRKPWVSRDRRSTMTLAPGVSRVVLAVAAELFWGCGMAPCRSFLLLASCAPPIARHP